jgi:hypothetical protein
MTVAFQLESQEFMALNGDPDYTFTEAVSLIANCESQEEVDEVLSKLSEGGEEGPCGWLKDRYGLAWHRRRRSCSYPRLQGVSGSTRSVTCAGTISIRPDWSWSATTTSARTARRG